MRLQRLYVMLALAIPTAARTQEPTIVDRILAAAAIPGLIDSLRLHGVPEKETHTILDDIMRRRIPATETRIVLEQADRDVKDRGPVNNFGAFVQTQLDAGLRGRALADAIHAEHERHGIGKGKHIDADEARGRSDSIMHGNPSATHGNSADARGSAAKGPPAGKGGPPAAKGGPPATKGGPPATKGPKGKP